MSMNRRGVPIKRSKVKREGPSEQRGRSPRYSQRWAKMVRRKAGDRCEVCGSTEDLTAHHILDRKRWPELKHNRHNGLLLCRKCHDKRHHADNPYLN